MKLLYSQYCRVWNEIFENDEWLSTVGSNLEINPILMGPGVRAYYDHTSSEEPTYMALLVCDSSGDILFDKRYRRLLFRSLKSQTFNEETCEIKFHHQRITLNIHDAIYAPEIIKGKPSDLFDILQADPICWYVSWNDPHMKLRRVAQKNTISLNGVVRMNEIGSICVLYLKHNSQSKRDSHKRFIFQDPVWKDLNITPDMDGNRIKGWKICKY